MPPQRVKRPSREMVKRRLLDAAAETLVTHGYGGASVELITARAGLSRGALYSNFADRESLYLELLDELEQRQIDEFSAIYQEHEDLSRFLDLLAARGRSGSRDIRSHVILQVELWLLAMRNDEVRVRLASIQARTLDALAGVFPDESLGLSRTELATVVSALGDGLLMHRLLDPEGIRNTLLVDVLRSLANLVGLIPNDHG